MVLERVILLSLLATQAVSAPSGCTELCTSFHRQYQTETSNGYQDHAGLKQAVSNLQNLDYSRPGNWSEHNEYRTNGGHGKVHEEQGQYVDNSQRVRYYKKNYTSSYSTNYGNGAELLEAEQQNNNYRHRAYAPNTQQTIHTQRGYDQVGDSESITQQHDYNRIHNQQNAQSIRRTNTHSERLEDFGEYTGNSQATQQGISGFNSETLQGTHHTNTQPENWNRVNSYKADGGHGHVFEEEGQYVTGPKKVRYYKRNYTSGYSLSGGIPSSDISVTGVQDIQKEIEKLHRELRPDFHHVSAGGHTATSNIAQTNINTIGAGSENLHALEADSYRHQNSYRGTGMNTEHHNAEQHVTDAFSSGSEQLPYRNPSQSSYGSERHSSYEKHEGYVTKVQPVAQYIIPTTGYTNVLTGNSAYNRNTFQRGTLEQQAADNLHQSSHLNTHQSRLTQISDDNARLNAYNQDIATHSGSPGYATQYKEHWSSSSHTKETSVPQINTDSMHVSEQSAQYNRNQFGHQHGSYHDTHGHDNYFNHRENNYNSAYRTGSGTLTTGALHLGQASENIDCTQDTIEQEQYGSRHHRKYKRSAKYDELNDMQQQTEDLVQQNQDFNEHLQQQTHPVSSADFLQQAEESDDLQQATGKIEFGPQAGYPHQQTTGKLEFGQTQESNRPHRLSNSQHLEDFTQQNEDLTQKSDGFNDFTQQTTGNIEFGRQVQKPSKPKKPGVGVLHLEDFNRDLTRETQGQTLNNDKGQISGKLELGQQTQHSGQSWKPINNKHLEDLTQQSEDLVQQNEDLTQQSEDLTQQTSGSDDFMQQSSGKLEFGQQSQSWRSNWDKDNTHTSGKLEFGQQTQNPTQPWKFTNVNEDLEHISQEGKDQQQQTNEFNDFIQQTSGKLEFSHQSQARGHSRNDAVRQIPGQYETGQQSQYPYQSQRPGMGNQRLEDLTQQTDDFNDFTQQSNGKLEFGHQSRYPSQSQRPGMGNQHVEDLTQQTDDFNDFTQQSSGKLEVGHHSRYPSQSQRPGIGNQRVEDLTQQTDDFNDFTQQSSGKLEVGHHSRYPSQSQKPGIGNQRLEDLTQQTDDFNDFTQQSSGKLEFGHHSRYPSQTQRPDIGNQQLEDLTQKTDDVNDFTQQSSGKLEFGHHSRYPYQSQRPGMGNQHLEDLTQQTDDSNDFTQQSSGKLEFGHHSTYPSQSHKPSIGNQHVGDLTQQTDGFDDFTQEPNGKLQGGEQSQYPYPFYRPGTGNQHIGDLTQQTGDFDGFTQQQNGKLEISQQTNHHSDNEADLDKVQKSIGKLDIESQFSQQEGEDTPVEQVHENHMLKPAEKPKPRPRYNQQRVPSHGRQEYDSNIYDRQTSNSDSRQTTMTGVFEPFPKVETEDDKDKGRRGDQGAGKLIDKENSKDSNQQTDINTFDIERGNVDQMNRLHKSNDATVGLQWHYTYHPSDLTNSEPVQNSFYPGLNYNSGTQQKQTEQFMQESNQKDDMDLQQQSSPYNVNQQPTQHTQGPENVYQQGNQNRYTSGDTHISFNQDPQSHTQHPSYAFGQRVEPNPQNDNSQAHVGQSEFAPPVKGKARHQYSQTDKPTPKLEPRILEAYGGGPYEATHDEEIYSRVTVNPSAALPPRHTDDSWDIREKPREFMASNIEFTSTIAPTEIMETITEATPPPSFWGRIGHKITGTYDKIKEKAKDVFG